MHPDRWIEFPAWLSEPAAAVLDHPHGPTPLEGWSLAAREQEGLDRLVLEHAHPARPADHDGEAGWACPSRDESLHRIGRREVGATSS